MDRRAKMFDPDSLKYGQQVEVCESGWLVENQHDKKFFNEVREYIYECDVRDMSHFVGEEFASMIKENNTTPLKKIQAMKARRVVQEIIDFQCQEVPMTKSANKR
jgi:hypothetical protein